MKRALHISPNAYSLLDSEPATRQIWEELALEYDAYHILARAADNKYHEIQDGKLVLHLVPGFFRPASFFFTSAWYLKMLLKKYKFHIVVCQCSILGGFWAVQYCKKKCPVFMEIHEVFYFDMLSGRRLSDKIFAAIIRYSLENASRIRVLNESMKERIYKLGIKNKRISVVYNRVNLSIFSKPKSVFELHKPIQLISAGNFVKSKGHVIAIKAVEILKNRYDIRLCLVGGGPLKSELLQTAQSLNVNLVLYDRIGQDELVHMIQNSDIYIHTSYTEGMPRAVLEAMAMRMPIVSTKAGFTEGTIINGQNGLLAPVGDAEAVAEAIEKLILNAQLRENLACYAYQDVLDKFEWKKCFDLYRAALKQAEKEFRQND